MWRLEEEKPRLDSDCELLLSLREFFFCLELLVEFDGNEAARFLEFAGAIAEEIPEKKGLGEERVGLNRREGDRSPQRRRRRDSRWMRLLEIHGWCAESKEMKKNEQNRRVYSRCVVVPLSAVYAKEIKDCQNSLPRFSFVTSTNSRNVHGWDISKIHLDYGNV